MPSMTSANKQFCERDGLRPSVVACGHNETERMLLTVVFSHLSLLDAFASAVLLRQSPAGFDLWQLWHVCEIVASPRVLTAENLRATQVARCREDQHVRHVSRSAGCVARLLSMASAPPRHVPVKRVCDNAASTTRPETAKSCCAKIETASRAPPLAYAFAGRYGAAGENALSAHCLVLCFGSIPSTSGGSDRSSVMDSDGRSKVITDRLDEVLDEVDMEITSQRQIINKLAEELGEDVLEHKALIKVCA